MKALIVDDEGMVRDVFARMVEESYEDTEIEFADNALLALEKLVSGGFDLLLVGVGMPGMDGVQLTAKVRIDYPAMRVILTSGAGEPPSHTALPRNLQAHAFVQQPFGANKVVKIIRRVMEA